MRRQNAACLEKLLATDPGFPKVAGSLQAMRILRHDDIRFARGLKALQRTSAPDPAVEEKVREIIAAVRNRGDRALVEYARQFDKAELTPRAMRVPEETLKTAAAGLEPRVKRAIAEAHANVRDFARRSLRKNWQAKNRQGALVGERFDPFQRVGIYVPAGTAPLASTVVMTATLAAAAGVPEIVVATPVGASGEINPAVAEALLMTGATEVYRIGGAQAIAALAYGTRTIAAVSKIFGPGNPWVVEAKRQVFGQVAVDLLPGPSEVLVIADATANAAWVAADLLAQAEHGHGSCVALVTDSEKLLGAVEGEMKRQLESSNRRQHLDEVLKRHAFLVLAKDMEHAVSIANDYAPEHLSLVARDAESLAAKIRTSGAIFIGGLSPVVAGDFLAGPSHELPTGGAGKSFAGLTVDQFQRRTSVVRYDEASLRESLPFLETFSAIEGLDAHGRSASIRLRKGGRS